MKITRAVLEKLGIYVPPRVEPNGKKRRKEKQSPDRAPFLAACKAHGLPEPIFEYQFALPRRWAFDYLFDGWLAVEREGGMFGIGEPCPTCKRRRVAGHTSIQRLRSDLEKYREAGILGYIVLRFLPDDFNDGSAFAVIKRALEAEGERP